MHENDVRPRSRAEPVDGIWMLARRLERLEGEASAETGWAVSEMDL